MIVIALIKIIKCMNKYNKKNKIIIQFLQDFQFILKLEK